MKSTKSFHSDGFFSYPGKILRKFSPLQGSASLMEEQALDESSIEVGKDVDWPSCISLLSLLISQRKKKTVH